MKLWLSLKTDSWSWDQVCLSQPSADLKILLLYVISVSQLYLSCLAGFGDQCVQALDYMPFTTVYVVPKICLVQIHQPYSALVRSCQVVFLWQNGVYTAGLHFSLSQALQPHHMLKLAWFPKMESLSRDTLVFVTLYSHSSLDACILSLVLCGTNAYNGMPWVTALIQMFRQGQSLLCKPEQWRFTEWVSVASWRRLETGCRQSLLDPCSPHPNLPPQIQILLIMPFEWNQANLSCSWRQQSKYNIFLGVFNTKTQLHFKIRSRAPPDSSKWLATASHFVLPNFKLSVWSPHSDLFCFTSEDSKLREQCSRYCHKITRK